MEHTGRDGGTYRSLRLTAYGKRRLSLGPVREGEAQRELRHVLSDLERGTGTPQPVEAPAEPERVPTFREFAEHWWLRNERRIAANTQDDYQWHIERRAILTTLTFAGLQIGELCALRWRDVDLASG